MIKKYLLLFTVSFFLVHGIYAQIKGKKPVKIIKIGLLVNNNTSGSAKNGAELAIEIANKRKKFIGTHFELLVRSMEGPWGTGSKEAVNLVFNEKVWAILGSHDGRNAHLVEQVIAKTHIVFLSAWATDPTLYQAFVPWFFSIVPNDDQQAELLAKEIIQTNKKVKIAALSDHSYDSDLALQSFLKKMSKMEYSEIIRLNYNNTDKSIKEIIHNINENSIDCVVLFGVSSSLLPLMQQLEKNKNIEHVYGALSLLANDGQKEMDFKQFQKVSIISYPNRSNNKNSSFIKSYKEKYGKRPGAVAVYAYDGMNLILEVIQNSNFDREKIQKTMAKIKFNGVTGLIQFDEHGSRLNTAELIHINDRIPVIKEN